MPPKGAGFPLLAVCLASLLPGCRVPQSAYDREPLEPGYSQKYSEEDEYSGNLFRRLTGRPAPRSNSSGPGGEADRSEVQQASAEAAIPPDSTLPGKELKFQDEETEASGFQLSDLAPSNLWASAKNAAGYGPNEGVARALYAEAEELYRQKEYATAAKRFESAGARWPNSPLAEDALFMQAESYFFSDQYPEARDAYAELLEKYSYTKHLDTASQRLFSIGRYWELWDDASSGFTSGINVTDSSRPWIDTFGHALKAYEAVHMNDPTGPLADDSVMAVANAHFKRHRFDAAADYYAMLRKNYPTSEHLLDAEFLEMRSKLENYQGTMYDGTPLDDAGELADQMLVQFRDQLGDKREHVLNARNEITEQKAARDMAYAEYYENKKLYGAARFYYQAILKDYPGTAVAEQARAKLDKIADLPAKPPNRFAWLTQPFNEAAP